MNIPRFFLSAEPIEDGPYRIGHAAQQHPEKALIGQRPNGFFPCKDNTPAQQDIKDHG